MQHWPRAGSAGLFISESQAAGSHTLRLAGELDLANVGKLSAAVVRLCKTGAAGVVLDLHDLVFIDARGLREIVLAKERCAEHRAEFSVVPSAYSTPTRLFALTGLAQALPWRAAPEARRPVR